MENNEQARAVIAAVIARRLPSLPAATVLRVVDDIIREALPEIAATLRAEGRHQAIELLGRLVELAVVPDLADVTPLHAVAEEDEAPPVPDADVDDRRHGRALGSLMPGMHSEDDEGDAAVLPS